MYLTQFPDIANMKPIDSTHYSSKKKDKMVHIYTMLDASI